MVSNGFLATLVSTFYFMKMSSIIYTTSENEYTLFVQGIIFVGNRLINM